MIDLTERQAQYDQGHAAGRRNAGLDDREPWHFIAGYIDGISDADGLAGDQRIGRPVAQRTES